MPDMSDTTEPADTGDWPRGDELLLAAADALDKGDDPLHVSFLSEHGVTLDEAYDLAEHLAIGARMFVQVRQELHEGGLVGVVGADRLVRALMMKKDSSPVRE